MSFVQVGDSIAKSVEGSGQVCRRSGYWKDTDFFSSLKKIYFHIPSSCKSNPNNTGRAER